MTSANIQGISHITFVCKNLEKTSNLLKQVFNAEEIYTSGSKSFSIAKEKFFKIGELWIAIMEGKPVKKTYNHIAFKVDGSLASFRKKIEACGLTILTGRKRDQAEGQSLYFYDYDNHLFELHDGHLTTRLTYYHRETKKLRKD